MKTTLKIISFLILFLIGCNGSDPVIDEPIDEPEVEKPSELVVEKDGPFIDGTNQWDIGSKLRGRYISENTIQIQWDIHNEVFANIKSFRIMRKAWHESQYKLIKTISFNSLSFVDSLLSDQIKPVWHYTIIADKKDGTASSTSQITVWNLSDLYSEPTSHSQNSANLWLTNQPGNSLSKESRFCLTDQSKWPNLSERTYGLLFYRNSIRDITTQELNNLKELKKNNQVKIGMETGGFQFASETPIDELGEKSYESEMRAISKLTNAGEKIDYVFFDGPIHRAMYEENASKPRTTVTKACEELADLMLLYKEYNPEIKFFLISNFSNWGWNGVPARNTKNVGEMGWGDYKLVLDTVIDVTTKRNVRLDGISIDYSYEAFLNEGSSDQINVIKDVDYKKRLKDLYDYTKGKGYQIAMSLNSNRGGNSSNHIFGVEVLNYLEEILRMGFVPDHILHQSWGDYPNTWLGENYVDSFTNIGLRLAEKYNFGK